MVFRLLDDALICLLKLKEQVKCGCFWAENAACCLYFIMLYDIHLTTNSFVYVRHYPWLRILADSGKRFVLLRDAKGF
jgi:hypothetical protein